jgi:hypothetical protein
MAPVLEDTGEERLIGQAEIVTGLRAAGGHILLRTQLGAVPDFRPTRAIRLAAAFERAFERSPRAQEVRAAHNVILATK